MKLFRPNSDISIPQHLSAKCLLLLTLWRSGTHWLAQMLCDMTGMTASYSSDDNCNYNKETLSQLGAMEQGHILIRHISLEPADLLHIAEQRSIHTIFLYRDPRDVIVSNIHMRKHREGYRPGLPPFPDMDMPDILSWELEHLHDAYARLLPNWAEAEHPLLAKARYEELHADAPTVLRRLAAFCGLEPSDTHLRQVIDANAFSRRTGREPGLADPNAHARKGIVGDFRTFFTESDLARIHTQLGSALDRLGYPR